MLNSLLIQNYAIIDKLELDFAENLTIITGETGAGKSILLGALELVLGKRADTKVLYDDSKKCVVEASFNTEIETVADLFEEYDLDSPEEIIIRREISNSGKSRAFINDTPVNLNILSQLSSRLLELHRQFDTLDIHRQEFQTRILDALSSNNKILIEYTQSYQEYLSSKKLLNQLKEEKTKAEEEHDYLKFQFEELSSLNLEDLDQELIESELTKLQNAEDIISSTSGLSRNLTEGDRAISDSLSEMLSVLRRISTFMPELENLSRRLDSSLEEIKDISKEIANIGESTVYDEGRIAELQETLDELYRIQQKNKVNTIAELIEIKNNLETKLKTHNNLAIEIIDLQKKIDQLDQNLRNLGSIISKNRIKIAPKLKKSVEDMLSKLSMEHAQLKVEVKHVDHFMPNGMDEISFLFAPNKGSQFLPIKNIASGGELSRLALCIKSNVASALTLPTMIFDELDTGISGEVAMKMGDIMHTLAHQHQIIAITHSPLIAAKADIHFSVFKKIDGDRTLTKIKVLDQSQRIDEIAKMLGGDPPGENAIRNAEELLQVN